MGPANLPLFAGKSRFYAKCPSKNITLLTTYSSSLLSTCQYHFNLRSCTFLDISLTFVVPLILSFLILSSLVTPLIHLNILISATSNFSLVLSSLPKSRHRASLLVLGVYNCLVYFPLAFHTYSSVAQNPRYPLPVFPPDCILSMRHLPIQVSIFCQCRAHVFKCIRSFQILSL